MESWATTCLLLAGELLVRDVSRQVGVQHSAEGQAVVPAAAEVGDVNVLKKKTKQNKLSHSISPERGPAALVGPCVLEIKQAGAAVPRRLAR